MGPGLWGLDYGARGLFVDNGSDFEGEFFARAQDGHRIGFIGRELFDDAAEVFGSKDSLFGDFQDDIFDFQAGVLGGAIGVDPSDAHTTSDG